MWRKATKSGGQQPLGQKSERGWFCQLSEDGTLRFKPRCAVVLGTVALTTGMLSGLFGVGGGFIIVPALVLITGMAIHKAIGTSLFIIVFVSMSGVFSNFVAGRILSVDVTVLFIAGGIVGLILGTRLGLKLPATALQRVFATSIVLVAMFVASKTLLL